MKFQHVLGIPLIFIFSASCHLAGKHEKELAGSFEEKVKETGKIEWIDSLATAGKIPMGDTAVFRFRLRNTAETALYIAQINTSCSCLETGTLPAVILPGKTDSVRIYLYTNRTITGTFHKTVRVRLKSGEQQTLRCEAEITGHKKTTGSY